MRSFGRVMLLGAAVLVSFSLPAAAQLEQSRLVGAVVDEQGAVLPGVTVTATSPALIGNQVSVTEADGRYRFPALPPGRYTLVFEMDGFQKVQRENIVLALGQTLNVDMTLEIAGLEESVTVSGQSPVVDVQSTKVGTEFTGEKLVGIPTSTDLWAALGQAPGIRMRGFDVGGSHKSQQTGYESFGLRDQNRVVTEGVDTTEGSGGTGFYQDYFAHEEISISAAGGDVTMNTPGAAVVSTIKSGGNEFKSLLNLTYEGESFVGNNIDDATAKRGFTGNPNLLFWEGHADLGGPIKRDKLWFYGAANYFKIDKEISGVDRNLATDIGLFTNFTGKGTWKATQKDTVVGYYQWGRKEKPARGLSVTVPPESILAQSSDSYMYNGQWQRVWSNRLFSDFKVGFFGYDWPMTPAVDWRTNPPRIDQATGNESGAGWLAGNAAGPFTYIRSKPQMMANLSYYVPDRAGSHDIKVGFEWFDDQVLFGINGNSGPILYYDRAGQVDEIRVTDVGAFEDLGKGWTAGDDRNMHHAAYIQDRWSPSNRMTVTVGLRYDRQRPYYRDSIRKPVLSDIFPATTVPGKTLVVRHNVAPRFGLSFDPKGDSSSVLKVTYGRYYFNFANSFGGANPGGVNRRNYKFNDLNGNRLYDGVHELGTLVASAGGTSTTLDMDVKTPYTDEVSVAFERQFWGESSGRVAYVRKMVRSEFATYNVARVGQYTVPASRAITLQSYDGGIEGERTITVYDIPASLRGVIRNTIATIPEGQSDFDTIQFSFNKRFEGGLFFQSSFDYQWRDELRSASASTSPLTADPIGTGFFLNPYPDAANRQKSTNWQFRAMGRYVFGYGIGLGLNYRVQSGWPYARLVSISLPNAGTQNIFLENIENNRSDTAMLVDLRVDKAFRFADKYKLTLMLDVFNSLNSNAVSNFNLNNGSRFNQIIATLDPRTAMLGIRFDF